MARLIVAMYIFLSAFGHYTYGLKRGASSWSRVAEVLFRLNLYTVLLCLTMDVPYLHYYFVPLISACYLLVLLVAAIPPVGEYIVLKVGRGQFWPNLHIRNSRQISGCIDNKFQKQSQAYTRKLHQAS